MRWRRTGIGDGPDLFVVEIGGDLQCHRHVLAVLVGQLLLAGLQLREQVVERLVLLQFAQVLGVRRGNIDGDVAGVVVNLVQADQVVVGRVFDRASSRSCRC
jgi:hypothetical protein